MITLEQVTSCLEFRDVEPEGLASIKRSIMENSWFEKEPYIYPHDEKWKTMENPTFEVLEGNHRITALRELCEEKKPNFRREWVCLFFLDFRF